MKYPVSPKETIHGLVYFRRMVDKIRLHAAGELAEDCIPNLGKAFDERCCKLLGISYGDLSGEIHKGLTDEQAWDWAVAKGKAPDEEQTEVWNGFMSKRGWNDEVAETLARRKKEGSFENRDDIRTMFDYIDADEGRAISKS
jgi:gluconokinase